MFFAQSNVVPTSLLVGLLIGVLDVAGFYWSAKLFFVSPSRKTNITGGIVEALKVALFVASIIFLSKASLISFWWLLLPAVAISVGGKLFFSLRRLNG